MFLKKINVIKDKKPANDSAGFLFYINVIYATSTPTSSMCSELTICRARLFMDG